VTHEKFLLRGSPVNFVGHYIFLKVVSCKLLLILTHIRNVIYFVIQKCLTIISGGKVTKFEEKLVEFLKELTEKVQSGKTVDFHLAAKKIKSLYAETLADEFEKLLPDRANRTTKRKLYGAPEKSLRDFTIIERWRNPEGYFISYQLPRKLPKDTEIQQLFTLLNVLSLSVHKYLLCKEICEG